MLFRRIQGNPLGIPSFFVVEPGGSYNWFLLTSSNQFCRFSDPCDDNSTTREIQLRNIFVSGEKWHKPQSYSIIKLGLYSNHVLRDTAGPQKVSVLTTSVCKLGLDFIFKSIFSIYFILR